MFINKIITQLANKTLTAKYPQIPFSPEMFRRCFGRLAIYSNLSNKIKPLATNSIFHAQIQ